MFIRLSILGFLANYKKESTDKYHLHNRLHLCTFQMRNGVNGVVITSIPKIDPNITGCDMRFPLIEEMDKDIIRKVDIYFAKARLVAYLEKNDISINDKLLSITNFMKYEIDSNYVNNITAGGLFKDWNFDIEKPT